MWAAPFALVALFATAIVATTSQSAAAPYELRMAKTVTISNSLPRRDTTGAILEAGDGSLHKFGDRWYLYGTRYLPCPVADQSCCYEWCGPVWMCGWRNMTFSVYSSPDLAVWTLETHNALPQALTHPVVSTRKLAFFEPAVIFNPSTRKYVMWWVIQMHGGDGGMGVATSDSPAGPFEYAWKVDPAVNRGRVPGWTDNADLYLWYSVSLGKAFMKHNGMPTDAAQDPPANYVSELSEDFLSTTATSAPIEPGVYNEGGGIFERNGSWYVTFGQGCCFCNKGGSTRVHRSQSPLGPYTYVGDINPAARPRLGDLPDSADDAGQGHPGVLQHESPPAGAFNGRGGRWYSAGGAARAGADGHQLVAAASASVLRPASVPRLSVSPPPEMLTGYYSGTRTDNAVIGSSASKAWAAANHYGEWSMFHGVAGAGAAAAAGGSAPAAPGKWSALVSYYSAAFEDWMLVADDTTNAARVAWITSRGYVQQRREGVYVATAPAATGYMQPMVQYWKQAINDTTLAGSAAVVQELEKQGYVKLWVEGYGVGPANPPSPSPPPKPKPPPPPKPPPRFECFGGPPGTGVCAKSTGPNATYVNDSTCNSTCPPAPVPPKQPAAYEIPAQQFGFTAVPSAVAGEEPTIMYVGLRFGSAPTKNHDFQYWEPLRFDSAGDILPLVWADNFTLAV